MEQLSQRIFSGKFFVIAGPCVIESESLVMQVAEKLKEITHKHQVEFIFKSSFDKANRSSAQSFRGPGIDHGLKILEKVKTTFQVPVLTDVHEDTPLDQVADVVDVLQTPAFLCRQTNFIQNVAKTGKIINLKKGQFLSPQEMKHVLEKAKATGNHKIMLCERGACFGYNNLVSDMRSLVIMKEFGHPVVFDATHSVQLPGAGSGHSLGQRQYVAPLARSAAAAGINGLFMETHPNPEQALSDGPNSVYLDNFEQTLLPVLQIHRLVSDQQLTAPLNQEVKEYES